MVRRKTSQLAVGVGLLFAPDRCELVVLQLQLVQPLSLQRLRRLRLQLRLRQQLQRLLPELHRERLRPQQGAPDGRCDRGLRQAAQLARRLFHLHHRAELQLVLPQKLGVSLLYEQRHIECPCARSDPGPQLYRQPPLHTSRLHILAQSAAHTPGFALLAGQELGETLEGEHRGL